MKYGLKQLSSTIIKKSNWPIAEAYLLKCGYGFPNTLQVITQIFATYHYHQYPLNKNALTDFCRNLLDSASAANHHSETAWLLWLSKEISITLDAALIQRVLQVGSSICSLIALDLHQAGLVDGEVDISSLESFASTQALYGPNWLLAYEGGRRLWLSNSDLTYIEEDLYFSTLLASGVGFYDEAAQIQPIFSLKEDVQGEVDFDSDDEIGDDFEFDNMDEEYFDSSSEDEADDDTEENSANGSQLDNLDDYY
ncbi:hypothetical protein I0E98_21955 [Pseudomonas lalucatii]|nr:hypothetical protein [Pseudomonas lalucatii]